MIEHVEYRFSKPVSLTVGEALDLHFFGIELIVEDSKAVGVSGSPMMIEVFLRDHGIREDVIEDFLAQVSS